MKKEEKEIGREKREKKGRKKSQKERKREKSKREKEDERKDKERERKGEEIEEKKGKKRKRDLNKGLSQFSRGGEIEGGFALLSRSHDEAKRYLRAKLFFSSSNKFRARDFSNNLDRIKRRFFFFFFLLRYTCFSSQQTKEKERGRNPD